MRVVGIKQLKARLSEYVRAARAGETVLVSDRDQVVAELGPVRRQQSELGSQDAVLEALAERGVVTRAGEPKSGWEWKPTGLGLSAAAAAAILDTQREDR